MQLIAYLIAAVPVVVVPDVPTAVERFAAEELAGELGRCLGETPFASRVRRERLSVDHMVILDYDALRETAKRNDIPWIRPATRKEAAENWIRDVKSFGVKARRETTSSSEIEDYFRKLREGGKP